MPSHPLQSASSQITRRESARVPAAVADRTLKDVLAPAFEAAEDSASLIVSRHAVEVDGFSGEIPKFLLLGQRGGGRPIRVGLFAGFEAGNLDSVQALTRILLQLKAGSGLTRDFALLAYPVVNVRGFGETSTPLSDFESRFARDSAEADVQFFKSQLRQWTFDGLISFRSDSAAKGFYAAVRSEIIAREVVEPALAAAADALPLATQAVKVRPGDRYARTADYSHGRLTAPADVRPYPFEIELFSPRHLAGEQAETGLFVVISEILRQYRALIAHAQNL